MAATPPPAVSWQSPAEPAGPAPGIEFAGHGARLVAYILDSIIVTAVCGTLAVVGFILLGSGTTVVGNEVTNIDGAALAGFAFFVLFSFVIGVLYWPYFWAHGGQTPGMRPFDLRVVSDRDGSRIGWGTAILRVVGLWVAFAVIYIGIIWIFIDQRRRGWQDLIAGTVVIKRP